MPPVTKPRHSGEAGTSAAPTAAPPVTAPRGRGEAGSGMTIGVAILFPMLVVTVMVLQVVADSARVEQALQATANRTAQTASLCCYHTDDAESVAQAGIAAAEQSNAYNRVRCNNNLVADSAVVFEGLNGDIIESDPDTPVPPAGLVHVYMTCTIPPLLLGGFVLGVFDAERTVVGTATIDPYRNRPDT